MGNKSTSPQLSKTLSINGHGKNNFNNYNDDTDGSLDNSSNQSYNGKKYGPSPRFRRRQTKQSHIDKKGKKPQPISSYLNVSLQSIGDRTVSLFSRSFNFLQPSNSSPPINQPQNHQHDSRLTNNDDSQYRLGSQSGVYRNQSRRKYQTSSLRNPYRRSSTNFPVRGHEAMFLPEFSIKGKVTEADFEVIDIIARGAFGNVIKVCSIHDKKVYAMKIMSKSQIVKDHAVQQVKGE